MPLVGGETITRQRFAAGTRVGGRWVDAASVSAPIFATVQAPSGNDMKILPEGTRASHARKIYTWPTDDLRTENQHTGAVADRVVIDGIVYEVVHVWPWRAASPIPHIKALVLRLQEQDTVTP